MAEATLPRTLPLQETSLYLELTFVQECHIMRERKITAARSDHMKALIPTIVSTTNVLVGKSSLARGPMQALEYRGLHKMNTTVAESRITVVNHGTLITIKTTSHFVQ